MSEPPARSATLRKQIAEVLRGACLDARAISALVSAREREVVDHLTHLAQSRHVELTVLPADCLGCGFVFDGRTRLARPSRCPRCKGERLRAPRFSLPLDRAGGV